MESVSQNRNRCFYCGIKIAKPNKKFTCKSNVAHRTKEHIIPISKGGKDCTENIIFACSECNCKRGNMDLEVFLSIQQDKYIIIQIQKLIKYASKNIDIISFKTTKNG